jgi:hypothetical protein
MTFRRAIISLFLLPSCVHEIPFETDGIDKSAIVVEGFITNEFLNHPVWLSRLSDYSDTARVPVSGAKMVAVTSSDNSATYYYKETSPGLYTSIEKFVGVTGNTYYLHVEVDSTVISAKTTMLPVTPPEKIRYSLKNNGYYSIDYVGESYVKENPAKYVLDLSWQDNNATLYYYSLTTIDIAQLFAPKMQITYFPEGTQIIERKYSIDKDYENYLRSLLAETVWTGGYFDEAHGNLHTNITSDNPKVKTAGYFSANTVYIDTVWVK